MTVNPLFNRDFQNSLLFDEVKHNVTDANGNEIEVAPADIAAANKAYADRANAEANSGGGSDWTQVITAGFGALGNIFGQKPTTPTPVVVNKTGGIINPNPQPKGLSTGAWIGIAAGGILVVGLIIFASVEAAKKA